MSWIPGWNSVAGAVWWSGFFFFVSIGALIALGMAEIASHRYSDRKDELAEIEQEAAQRRHDEDMTRVQHDTAAATERAAKLEKDAAVAQKEAAEARLEQERLKAQMAWRTIPENTASNLRALLAVKPGQVNVQYPEGDGEAKNLAIQFAKIFQNAGWEIGMFSANMHTAVAWGLFVPDPASEVTTMVRQALAAAGIGFSTEALPPSGIGFGSVIPDAPILFVGTKPPPQ